MGRQSANPFGTSSGKVGLSQCNFWYDKWLGSGALYLRVTVRPDWSFGDFIVQGRWDIQWLGQVLPSDIASSVMRKPTLGEVQDAEVI